MTSELEKDINEIKVSVARIEEKLKLIDTHVIIFNEHDKRIRALENYRSKSAGWVAAIGAVIGAVSSILTAIIIKLIIK